MKNQCSHMEDKTLGVMVDDVKDMDFESTEVYLILFLEDSPDDVELMEHIDGIRDAVHIQKSRQ